MTSDHENTVKAAQCAALLHDDIRAICASDNLLLSDSAMDLIALAGEISRKLARMELAIRPEGAKMDFDHAVEMTIQPATIILRPGQKGTYSGFSATVIRHYDGNMYEIRVPGGITCVSARDFIPA